MPFSAASSSLSTNGLLQSLNNAIFLSDDADAVQKKVMQMYTDPKRLRVSDPGETDPNKNPLWAFHDAFNTDTAWVAEQREAYQNGKVGDVVIKRKLVEILNALIDPIRTRRKHFENRPDDVMDALIRFAQMRKQSLRRSA